MASFCPPGFTHGSCRAFAFIHSTGLRPNPEMRICCRACYSVLMACLAAVWNRWRSVKLKKRGLAHIVRVCVTTCIDALDSFLPKVGTIDVVAPSLQLLVRVVADSDPHFSGNSQNLSGKGQHRVQNRYETIRQFMSQGPRVEEPGRQTSKRKGVVRKPKPKGTGFPQVGYMICAPPGYSRLMLQFPRETPLQAVNEAR